MAVERTEAEEVTAMYDEILEACARDELRDLGLDEDAVAESLATMREQGMFNLPDWTP